MLLKIKYYILNKIFKGSMTFTHKKNRNAHKKKVLQNAMTNAHEFDILT